MMTQRKRQHSLKQIKPSPIMRRSQIPIIDSPKILPSIAQNHVKKNSTKDLTLTISKFTNNNQKQSIKYSEQLLRSGLLVLKGFSETQNNFQNLFIDLYEVLKRFTFCFQDREIQAILQQFRVKQGYSFRKTCICLHKQLSNVMKDRTIKLQMATAQLTKIKLQLETVKKQWAKQKQFLQQQAEKYKKLSNVQYTQSLQKQVKQLKVIISDFQIDSEQLNKRIEQLVSQILKKDYFIEDLSAAVIKSKSQLQTSKTKIQKLQTYFPKMRIRFDELLVKLLGIKQVITKVEEQNSMLVSQRIKLVNRAAVTFEDLTPRPKYKQILGINVKSHINSSQNIFSKLVEHSGMKYKDIVQKVILAKQTKKLQQVNTRRDKIVNDIISAKKQMDSLEEMIRNDF